MDERKDNKEKRGSEYTRMSDIAAKAGVSLMTVSRALRQPSKVAPITLARIKSVVEEMDYVPNHVAGALAAKRSDYVVVIIPNLRAEIYSECVEGISKVCDAAGLKILLGVSGYSVETEYKLLESLMSHRPAGIILTGHTHLPETRELIRKRDVPVVETFNISNDPIGTCVGYSNFRSMYDLTTLMLDRGCSDIVHLCTSYAPNDRNADRRAGYAAAMRDRGLGEGAVKFLPTDFTYSGAGRAVSDYLDNVGTPDGIVCGGDILAIGALLELQRRNINVPQEIALAGFDDLELSAILSPAITTVRVPRRAMGEVAAEHLIRQIDGKGSKQRILDLGYEIIRRETA
jgi:LacI family transcriptional regulator, gluconate utilization system Gnt-I transcriptional repressor